MGLRPLLRDNPDAGTVVRMLMSLPLLPAARIQEGLDAVREETRHKPFYEQLVPFIDYVQRTWLDGKGCYIIEGLDVDVSVHQRRICAVFAVQIHLCCTLTHMAG